MGQTLLADELRQRRNEKGILLCSHSVLGYPHLDQNSQAIEGFIEAGADIMELQFPYSDPMADGPVLMHANQEAVAMGVSVDECFLKAKEVVRAHPNTFFLIMTYYNIVFCRGEEAFAKEARASGVRGIIVPDLPLEESRHWVHCLNDQGISPIFMVTPETTNERMKAICAQASGFIYCVARKGITGRQSKFGPEFRAYIERVRAATSLPLAVGFGIRTHEDVASLRGLVDIAISCSRPIEILGESGLEAAMDFIKSLRGGIS